MPASESKVSLSVRFLLESICLNAVSALADESMLFVNAGFASTNLDRSCACWSHTGVSTDAKRCDTNFVCFCRGVVWLILVSHQ
ncbi:hypothetical protein O9992_01520 [Vibrio lentus]|nr:hypothetical protein [Vibrio lentus]